MDKIAINMGVEKRLNIAMSIGILYCIVNSIIYNILNIDLNFDIETSAISGLYWFLGFFMLFLIPFLSFVYLPLSSLTFIYRIKIADNKYRLWYFIFLITAVIYLLMQFLKLMVFGS